MPMEVLMYERGDFAEGNDTLQRGVSENIGNNKTKEVRNSEEVRVNDVRRSGASGNSAANAGRKNTTAEDNIKSDSLGSEDLSHVKSEEGINTPKDTETLQNETLIRRSEKNIGKFLRKDIKDYEQKIRSVHGRRTDEVRGRNTSNAKTNAKKGSGNISQRASRSSENGILSHSDVPRQNNENNRLTDSTY